LTFAYPADSRVTAHPADGSYIKGKYQNPCAQAGASQRCLDAGMAGTDNHYIKIIHFTPGTVLKTKEKCPLFLKLENNILYVYLIKGGNMPRSARITIENACYHIITRGNQKQTVFKDPADYQKYLLLLSKYKRKYGFKLYCFCLMPNHVHLVIEVNKTKDLNKIMRGMNLSYTLYFNMKYEKVGHLWQDRFKSKVIEKDAYLLECIKYIENNPIRASLVSSADEYLWGSNNYKGNKLLDSLYGF